MQKASVIKGKRSIALIAYFTFIFEIITFALALYSKRLTDIAWLAMIGRAIVELLALALMYNGKSFARFLIGSMFVITVGINVALLIAINSQLVTAQIVIIALLLLIQLAIAVYPFIAKDISGYAIYTTQYENLNWVWNWSGKCFGYIDRDELWKYSGEFAGLVVKDNDVEEVYNENGDYICEVYINGRLTVNLNKKGTKKIDPYTKPSNRPAFEPRENKIKMPIYNEYEDFWM
jgi:hypothetical protein